MVNINVEQGTQDWLELRRKSVTASDCACLMGVGFETPYQRWMKKITGEEEPVNDDMQRGKDLEPVARAEAERIFETPFYPETHIHAQNTWAMASLDGISPNGTIIEIKCPRSKGHEAARLGVIADYYIPQLQWQMYVAEKEEVQFLSYCDGDLIPILVKRDQTYIDILVKLATGFYESLATLTPPALTSKDVKEIVLDDGFEAAAAEWKAAKQILDTWEIAETDARKRLQTYAKNGSVKGYGVKVLKSIRSGNVDYSSIPELKNVDLDQYRKKPSEIYRISLD